MSSEETTVSKSQSGIQSLEIGLSVLDVLIEHNEPMMLKYIAHKMQMHPSKMHRYLVSLIRKDYARKLDDGRYGLGTRVNALGHTGFDQNSFLQRLTDAATEIKDTLHCGVQIAKWFSEGPIVIQSFEPDSPISIITRIGSRMPLASSATGRLFASYQANTIIKPLVFTEWQGSPNSLIAELSTKLTKTELSAKWQDFTQLQTNIQAQGYAMVTGDMLMGINAISIPIALSQSVRVVDTPNINSSTSDVLLEYAITVIGTTEQLPLDKQKQVIDKVFSIVQRYQLA